MEHEGIDLTPADIADAAEVAARRLQLAPDLLMAAKAVLLAHEGHRLMPLHFPILRAAIVAEDARRALLSDTIAIDACDMAGILADDAQEDQQ